MRLIVTLALALLCAPVFAGVSCLPLTPVTPAPIGTGSTVKDVETPAAEAAAFWCPVTVNGVTKWQTNVFWTLKKTKTTYDWKSAFARIKAAPGLLAAVNAELSTYSVQPASGTQDAFDRDMIIYLGCKALATKPYLVPIADLPATYCGAEPIPPVPVVPTWQTMNSVGLKVYTNNNGKLGPAIPGRVAPANFACNSTVQPVKLGTSVYYPLTAAPLNELYLCRLVQ